MKYGKILILITLGLITTKLYSPFAWGAPKTKFSLVYTNDVMGEVEPCG